MTAQSNRAQQVAADIAELKTDVKYIRESLPKLDTLTDLVTRHDERIASLEGDEEQRRCASEQRKIADKSAWWSAKVALVSAVTTALFAFIRAIIEHFIWKPHT
jgi:hypothetical protein